MLESRHRQNCDGRSGHEGTGLPRILHFGVDRCRRTSVLESAGFDVIPCVTLDSLLTALRTEARVDAVIVGDADAAERVLDAVRHHSSAPLILFQTRLSVEPTFDLLIAPQTPPQSWLRAIAELIGRGPAAMVDQACDASVVPNADAASRPEESRFVSGNVRDWHAVALSISRKPSAKPDDAKEPSVGGGKSARRI